MCLMVTMMYGSGMPLLYAFACVFCLLVGFFDKRLLLRVCRRPPRYGTELAELAMQGGAAGGRRRPRHVPPFRPPRQAGACGWS